MLWSNKSRNLQYFGRRGDLSVIPDTSRCGLGDSIYMLCPIHSVSLGCFSLGLQCRTIKKKNMFFSRMRDLQAIDSLLLKELKSCCAKEYNFLPRETGLKLMESASTEVTHWPSFTSLAVCADIWVCLKIKAIFSDVLFLIYYGAFFFFRITVECLRNAETPEWRSSGAWPVSLATAPTLLFKLSICLTDSSPLWR